MARYIDADKLHVYSYEFPTLSKRRKARIPMVFYGEIQNAPTVSPNEVRGVGKWLTEYEPNGRPYQFHCSVCDSDFSQMGITHASNYCPNCGAKMEVSEDA